LTTPSLGRNDIDLARGTITVRHSKTDAGVRVVYILPALRGELGAYLAGLDLPPCRARVRVLHRQEPEREQHPATSARQGHNAGQQASR
jgi:integrase